MCLTTAGSSHACTLAPHDSSRASTSASSSVPFSACCRPAGAAVRRRRPSISWWWNKPSHDWQMGVWNLGAEGGIQSTPCVCVCAGEETGAGSQRAQRHGTHFPQSVGHHRDASSTPPAGDNTSHAQAIRTLVRHPPTLHSGHRLVHAHADRACTRAWARRTVVQLVDFELAVALLGAAPKRHLGDIAALCGS